MLSAEGTFQRERQVQRPGGRQVPGVFGDQHSSDIMAESSRRGCQGHISQGLTLK